MAKVRQNISGTYRYANQAQAYCRISSYLQSMSLQGYSSLGAMQNALNGNALAMFGQSKLNHINQQFQQPTFHNLGWVSSCKICNLFKKNLSLDIRRVGLDLRHSSSEFCPSLFHRFLARSLEKVLQSIVRLLI